MGPFGGSLLSAAAPIFVVTQVYFNGIGIYDAWQSYKATGDNRLLIVRSTCAGINLALTVIQLRLSLRRG